MGEYENTKGESVMSKSKVVKEFYFTAHDGVMGAARRGDSVAVYPELEQLTFCVLLMDDGAVLTGNSRATDEATARANAKEDAVSNER